MQLSQLKADQLGAFLASLTPKAAAFLVREVERDKLRGGDAYPHDFVLSKARVLLRECGEVVARPLTPTRVFCMPFEDLLVDTSTPEKHIARIRRSSIKPIWKWVTEELELPSVAQLTEMFADGERKCTDLELGDLCDGIYTDISAELHEHLDGLQPGYKSYMRLAAQFGGEVVLEDAREMAVCLAAGGKLLRLRSRLPDPIREISPTDMPLYVELYSEIEAERPEHAYIFLLSVLRRTLRVSDTLRIVCFIVGSEQADVIATHRLNAVCEAVMHDIEVSCESARDAIVRRATIEDIKLQLAQFHSLSSGLIEVIELAPSGRWGGRLVALRSTLSAAIRDQISSAPRLIKAALFPRSSAIRGAEEAKRIVPPDDQNIADAVFVVNLIITLRFHLDQLSINADYNSIRKQVEQFVEAVGERILRELQVAGPECKENCLAYLEAAGQISTMLFGDEVGSLLVRRGKSAAHASEEPTAE